MRKGRDARGRAGRQAAWLRVTAAASSATLLGTLGLAGTSMAATGAAAKAAKPAVATAGASCHLGNGVKHVVTLMFDNVHFFRDNPNVPSDLELMPNLLNFFDQQRHVPVQQPHAAHRAHRRRHPDHATPACTATGTACRSPTATRPTTPTGRPTRRARSPTGPTRSSTRKNPPNAGHDTNPSMVYSPVPPATAAHPRRRTPSPRRPWVPFTRAGCDVGEVATANQELENTAVDIPKVFGPTRRRPSSWPPTRTRSRTPRPRTTSASACTAPRATRSAPSAKGVKFGQTRPPSATAVSDLLPDEPGGYNGFQALFGHRYVAPQLGAGTPNLTQQRRTRSPTRPGTWSTRTATRSTARSSPTTPASPASARSTPRRRWPTWPTCWSPASRS